MSNKQDGYDEFGNPLGKAYDLGGIDDDRLKGERILLYTAYVPGKIAQTLGEKFEWHYAQQAVAERNLQMDILEPQDTSRCQLDANLLKNYTQLWYVSANNVTLSQSQVDLIVDFVNKGNGLLIWADNEPFYADANLLAQRLIGTQFSGNKLADQVMSPASTLSPRHFIEHALTSGVNSLYEGITICTIAPAQHLTLLAQSHDGQMCMACYEQGDKRIVLDTGFTKLYQGAFHKTAGTARYFRNIAFWLARGSRGRNYVSFTPGRDRIATLNPGGSSERYKHTIKKPATLTYLLHWEGNATLGLVVQNPQGQTVYDNSTPKSPLRVEVPANQAGDWVCWVKAVNVPKQNFAYVLTLVEGAPSNNTQVNVSNTLVKKYSFTRGRFSGNAAQMYTQNWSSKTPGCIIVLLDQSDSMSEVFGGNQIGAGKRKADMVTTVLNGLLNELIKTNTSGQTIKPRADIAVLGYEGGSINPIVGATSKQPFVNLPELKASPKRIETRERQELDDNGNLIKVPVQFPVWIEPHIGSATPMCLAFNRACELADQWSTGHGGHYPPVVLNITDGASTDGDPREYAAELRKIYTQYGETLLFNCHITNLPAATLEFPNTPPKIAGDIDNLAPLLYEISSQVPAAGRKAFEESSGRLLTSSTRGFIFNGDAASIRLMFNFATVGAVQFDPNR